jgi:hypothetical protein
MPVRSRLIRLSSPSAAVEYRLPVPLLAVIIGATRLDRLHGDRATGLLDARLNEPLAF